MKLWHRVQILWPLLFLLVGCSGNRDLKVSPSAPHGKVEQAQGEAESSKGDLFVLLPEPNGKAGSIRVANAGGSQILDKPGDMTRVEDFNRPPIAPLPLDEKGVASIFGDALSAQPDLTPRFVSFTLWFESDKTKFTDVSKETLPEILRTIKIRKPKEIHIVGHTDRVGTDSHNLKLSSRRADLVRDFLTFKGIKSSVLFVSFHGESRPLVYTEDEVAEPLNRRVEVMIR
jgi:outer membrane protein OmpA-like peptidoglycan-associated protein